MSIELGSQIICNRGEFHKLLKDKAFTQKIAGFTSIPLSHLMRGYSPDGFSVFTYPSYSQNLLYADLASDVFESTFGIPPNHYRGYKKLLRENRENYGPWGAAMEYFIEQSFSTGYYREYSCEDISNICQLVKRFRRTSIEELNRLERSPIEFVRDPDEREKLKQMFPRQDDLIQTLIELRDRRGVQVIHGNKPDFIKFLKSSKSNSQPDDDCAVKFHQDVPKELVIAVVALGKHEEGILLPKKFERATILPNHEDVQCTKLPVI